MERRISVGQAETGLSGLSGLVGGGGSPAPANVLTDETGAVNLIAEDGTTFLTQES